MGLGISIEVILAFAFGLVLLYLAGWLLVVPLKMLLKLICNAIIGGIILWVLNFFGGIFGVNIALNPVTALVTGVLGVPGVLLLLVLKLILK